jgi:hypothetical protein
MRSIIGMNILTNIKNNFNQQIRLLQTSTVYGRVINSSLIYP